MTVSQTEKSNSGPPFLEFGFRPPISEISGSAPESIINGGVFDWQSCPRGGEFDHKNFESSNAWGVAQGECLSFGLIDA